MIEWQAKLKLSYQDSDKAGGKGWIGVRYDVNKADSTSGFQLPVVFLVDDVLSEGVDYGLAPVLVRHVAVPLQNLRRQMFRETTH